MEKQFFRNLGVLFAAFVLALYMQEACGQTIDEIIASSTKEAASFDFMGDIDGTVTRVELDMMLSLEQYNALYDRQKVNNPRNIKSNRRLKRKATQSLATRWTNNEIPYSMEDPTFTRENKAQIFLAIKEWEDNTCINFRAKQPSDPAYIHFEDGTGCSSYIGMGKGKREISLADGCRSKGVIAHEIGHAVGFYHEQNRPDRDDYVIIKRENLIHPDLYSNFQKYNISQISTYEVPYDYTSIMHYGGRAFSANGQYTIQTINPAFQNEIGNRNGLSFLDIKLANLMYNCGNNCKSTLKCPKEGFMNKNCTCLCPGGPGNPVKKCEGTSVITERPLVRTTTRPTTVRRASRTTIKPTTRTTLNPTTCTDLSVRCPAWAKTGYCQTSNYVMTYCKASCSTCKAAVSTTVSPCVDVRPHCSYWGTMGFCSGTYQVFMASKCPMTCGLCKERAIGKDGRMGGYSIGNSSTGNSSTGSNSTGSHSITENNRGSNVGNVSTTNYFLILFAAINCLLRM